jgi:hypothetical protein
MDTQKNWHFKETSATINHISSDDLLVYLFDGKWSSMKSQYRLWLGESPRFQKFTETYKDKIRKKIRNQTDEASILDLTAELATAYLLVENPRFQVAYEPYTSGKTRGPDFAVTTNSGITFNVEATRMRDLLPDVGTLQLQNTDLEQLQMLLSQAAGERIGEVVWNKLSQMRASMANLLVIHAEEPFVSTVRLGPAMARLKLRAEHKDPDLYLHGDLRTPADFVKYYQRLNGILLRCADTKNTGNPCQQAWENRSAKLLLPEKGWWLQVGKNVEESSPAP